MIYESNIDKYLAAAIKDIEPSVRDHILADAGLMIGDIITCRYEVGCIEGIRIHMSTNVTGWLTQRMTIGLDLHARTSVMIRVTSRTKGQHAWPRAPRVIGVDQLKEWHKPYESEVSHVTRILAEAGQNPYIKKQQTVDAATAS